MPKDAQVTIVGATMPEELLVDTLQDMLPVRCSLYTSEQLGFQLVFIVRFSNEFSSFIVYFGVLIPGQRNAYILL